MAVSNSIALSPSSSVDNDKPVPGRPPSARAAPTRARGAHRPRRIRDAADTADFGAGCANGRTSTSAVRAIIINLGAVCPEPRGTCHMALTPTLDATVFPRATVRTHAMLCAHADTAALKITENH